MQCILIRITMERYLDSVEKIFKNEITIDNESIEKELIAKPAVAGFKKDLINEIC